MDIDLLIATLTNHEVRFLLIGGMNYVLRHEHVVTYDIDIWIEDTPINRTACEVAIVELGAEWGRTDDDWGPLTKPGWMHGQSVFCLTTTAGAVDIFLSVKGLSDWSRSFAKSLVARTDKGLEIHCLCDEDMLACQLALDPPFQKQQRIERLRQALAESKRGSDDG